MKGIKSSDFEFADNHYPYSNLGEVLDNLPVQGLIVDEGEINVEYDPRIKISRTYLFLLGYLPSDNNKSMVDEGYSKALQQFRREAGLEPIASQNGLQRLTLEAWNSLLTLSAFDADIDVGQWLTADSGLLALTRAVHLRLFSYGLISRPPVHKPRHESKLKKLNRDFDEGLNKFVRVLSLLGITNSDLSPTINAATLTILFDQSALIEKLSSKGSGFKVFAAHKDFPQSKKNNRLLIRSFVGNLATSELWLLGYSVRPGNFKTEGAAGRSSDGSIHKAIREFCKDNDLSKRFKRTQDITIGYWLFYEMKKAYTEKQVDEVVISDSSINKFAANKPELRKVNSAYRSLGARLVDGVKRVARWLRTIFLGVAKLAKRVIHNFARLLHHNALIIYRRLKVIVSMLKDGFNFFFNEAVDGSDPEQMMMSHDKDFDIDVVINSSGNLDHISAFSKRVYLRSQLFSVACKVVAHLLELLKVLLKSTGNALGWMGLLLSMASLGNWLNSLALLSEEGEYFFDTLFQRELVSI